MRLPPLLALSGALGLLAGCGDPSGDPATHAKPGTETGPGLALTITADKATHYQMLCHVRTYTSKEGGMVNTYGVDTSGPYKDTIPSPNAQCHAKIVSGPGPVTLTLTKPDATQTATITQPGDSGEVPLLIY